MEVTGKPPHDMYRTTSDQYGCMWQTSDVFAKSITQSPPYKTIMSRRHVTEGQLPQIQQSMVLRHDPENPCGIQSMSNLPTNTLGKFTNTRRDLFVSQQGLWSNSAHNTAGAHINTPGTTGTYSNLQGAWGRVGPSTYEATHGRGPWVSRGGAMSFEPPTLRSMYDSANINPSDSVVPFDYIPPNK